MVIITSIPWAIIAVVVGMLASANIWLTQGLTEIEVRSTNDVMMIMNEGEKNRTVACTKMNTNRYVYNMYKMTGIANYLADLHLMWKETVQRLAFKQISLICRRS